MKTIALSLAGASLLTTGLVALGVSAAEFVDDDDRYEEREYQQRERREQMSEIRDAIDANDYQAWADAMSEHPGAEEFITQENFDVLVQAHELKESGDREGAKALLEEAGIKRPKKFRGNRGQRGEKFQAIRDAVEAGDYQAWVEAMADHPNGDELINEETFSVLQEAHVLREAGDKDAAKALLEEAGLRPDKGSRGPQGQDQA